MPDGDTLTQPADRPAARTAEAPAKDATGPANLPKLIAENLNVFYGEKHALKNIDLAINRGEVTALIGPSGCGKTTFLKALNRLLDIIPGTRTEGTILMDGEDVNDKSVDVTHLRRRFGVVAQKPDPFPFSIHHNVSYAPKLHGLAYGKQETDELVEKSLRRVHLWDEVKDILDQPGTNLSGGQQQRLCIARAIAYDPEVILFDEPCSALDPLATARIEELIGELRGDYTQVIVTHNMEQAMRVCDRAAFFHMGDLIEHGTRDEIFEKPGHHLTQAFISGRIG